MYQIATQLFIRNITPMHVGSGNDLGFVDLPIQREKHTQYPKIEASSLKGCIREYFENDAKDLNEVYMIHNLFGYDSDSLNKCLDPAVDEVKRKQIKVDFEADKKRSQYAGAIGFTDARILFFPVKSMKGVFAYVTCPSVLKRWIEELRLCKVIDDVVNFTFLDDLVAEDAKCFKDNKVTVTKEKNRESENEQFVVLEDYLFNLNPIELGDEEKQFESIINSMKIIFDNDITSFLNRVVIVNDDDFKDFVNLSTEIITRTKINNVSGTVATGALFNEEYLPAETIMYTIAMYSPAFSSLMPDNEKAQVITAKDVQKEFEKKFKIENTNNKAICMQIGAGATIGKGICKIGKCGAIK